MNGFVTSSELREWGIGRLTGCDPEKGTVGLEYFQSPLEGVVEVSVSVDSIRPHTLQRQTRAYVPDASRAFWIAGRLLDDGAVDASALDRERYPDAPGEGSVYLIGFPKGIERAFRPEEVYVRWAKPLLNPTVLLASQTHDGPFLYEKRSRVLKEIFRQRAVFSGMTSLASSSIELHEHQIRAVRRVLHDPVRRYILADEVGLGKTIEAGVLIRQHVLDNPESAQVLVVVPPHLKVQWQNELVHRLNLTGHLGARLVVSTPDQISRLPEPEHLDTVSTLLVVDEAHQVCRDAYAEAGEGWTAYQRLKTIAQNSSEVLLLSATPVLRNEDGFLAMLHLLDPEVYRLEERAEFRDLIKKSQSVADLVASLTPRQNPALLKRTLRDLDEMFVGDTRVQELAAQLRPEVESPRDSPARMEAIDQLRLHLQETHRIHRRLIRTPRSDPSADDFLPLGRVYETRPYRDPQRMLAFDTLEEWRFEVLNTSLESQRRVEAADLFSDWVVSALSSPRALSAAIASRLSALRSGEGEPFFGHEDEQLEEALSDLDGDDTEYLDQLGAVLRERIHTLGDKAVLFTSSRDLARGFRSALSDKVPGTLVLHSPYDPTAIEDFVNNSGVSVLVVDRDGEEGLNLQRVKAAIVHADLPLSPMRVEQRIGRIDRLRSKSLKVLSIIPYADSGYEKAVFEFMEETGVFSKSIAPLQFLLEEILQSILSRLLEEGTDSLDSIRREMNDSTHPFCLETEARNTRRIQALDEMDRSPQEEAYYQTLEDYEYGHGAQEFSDAVSDWLGVGCLGLKRLSENGKTRFAFSPSRTQLPKSEFVRFFGKSVDRQLYGTLTHPTTFPMAFDRVTAVQEETPLARIGHSVIDALEGQSRSEERGVAFAIWRQVEGYSAEADPGVFFRFDFLIEAAVDPQDHLLRRRADRLFPPVFETVWLDPRFEKVADDSVSTVLDGPFGEKNRVFTDTTLRAGDTWPRITELVSGDWPDLCERAFYQAQEIVIDGGKLRTGQKAALEMLESEFSRTRTILVARAGRMGDQFGAADTKALSQETNLVERIRRAIETPIIRPEFAGAVLLSRAPFPAEEPAE